MSQLYTAYTATLFKRNRIRLILRPILVVLALFVVLATAFMLIRPGITMERKAVCGLEEHMHDAGCYESVLVCGYNDVPNVNESNNTSTDAASETAAGEEHIHTDACYETKLICGLEEHTHQDSCYETAAATLAPSATPTTTPSAESDEELSPVPFTEPVTEPSPTAAATLAPSATPTTTPSAESDEELSPVPSTEPVTEPTPTPATEFIFENDTISVSATLSETAVLPVGAELRVNEITSESDPVRYKAFQDMLPAAADGTATDGTATDSAATDGTAPEGTMPDASNQTQMLAYDIGFFIDGTEVEPTGGSVQVTIQYKSPLMNAVTNEDVNLYHVVETAASVELETVQGIEPVVSKEGTVQSITFDTDSFSDYVVVTNSYTMSSSLQYLLVDQASETFINTSYYNAANPLGIAGNFHIVAFDTLRMNSHTNGNILANNFYASANFGTKGYGPEISYIQNYMTVNGGSAADADDVLAVGSSQIVSLVDNGNAFAISGTKIDTPQTIWQDNDTAALPFINLAAVKTQIQDIASVLKSNNTDTNITPYTADMNNCYLTINDTSKVGVYNMTAATLMSTFTNGFSVRGFTTGTNGSVIINIDCAGQPNVTVPKVRMYIDGVQQDLKEMTTFASGKIILNFVNSANVNLTFNETHATVVAPDANITLGQNLNGTVIGNNVTINAESHRTDFTGTFGTKITVTKNWFATNGTPLTDASISNLAVSVQLYCNNVAMTGAAYTVTLNPANSWTYVWNDLNIGSGQKYSAREKTISRSGVVIQTGEPGSPYTVAYTNNAGIMNGLINVRNTVAPGSVQITKTWRANDGSIMTGASIAGLSASVQLYRNNVAMVDSAYTVTLNAGNSWTYTWGGLDISSGQTYTVREAAIGGYAISYTNNSGIQIGIISITNTKGQPFELPATGGSGPGVLYATGIVMLLFVFLMTGMKMKHRKRKGGTSSA